jgi:hypothetical protein
MFDKKFWIPHWLGLYLSIQLKSNTTVENIILHVADTKIQFKYNTY